MSCCVQFHLNQIDIRTISGVHIVHGSLKCQRLEDNFDAWRLWLFLCRTWDFEITFLLRLENTSQ